MLSLVCSAFMAFGESYSSLVHYFFQRSLVLAKYEERETFLVWLLPSSFELTMYDP